MSNQKNENSIESLTKKQSELNTKTAMLKGEVRRLTEEIDKIEVTKNTVSSNQGKINLEVQEISTLKKNITSEINKLSNLASSMTPIEESDVPPPPPFDDGPPPPPDLGTMSSPKSKKVTQKVEKVVETKADTRGDMLQEMQQGRKLSSVDRNTIEKTQDKEQETAQKIKNLELSIKTKEEDIEKSISRVSELSSKLKTVKESQPEYQKALQSQTELLLDLGKKKKALNGKLGDVKAQVEGELLKIEEKKRVEEVTSINNEQSVTDDGPPPPPPPDMDIPPPPPMMDSFKARFQRETSVLSKSEDKVEEAIIQPKSSKEDNLDKDAIIKRSEELKQKREAQELKNYLVNKLIDVVLEGDSDEELETLSDILEDDGVEELKIAVNSGVESLSDKSSNLSDPTSKDSIHRQIFKQFGNKTLEIDTKSLKNNRDKQQIKDAVSKFISADSDREVSLLDAGKGMKQREEEVAKKQAEAKRINDMKKQEENEKRMQEEKRVQEEKRNIETQKKLSELGVKEGAVDLEAVKNSESKKIEVIQEVELQKSDLQETDDFLSSIDTKLNESIIALNNAESLQVSSKPIKQDESVVERRVEQKEDVVERMVEQDENVVEQMVEQDENVVEQMVEQDENVVEQMVEQDENVVEQMVEQDENVVEQMVEQDENVVEQIVEQDMGVIGPAVRQEWAVEQIVEKEKNVVEQKEVVVIDQNEVNNRKSLLKDSGFDKALHSIIEVATSLSKEEYVDASKEAYTLSVNLLNNKTDFIAGKKTAQEFLSDCQKSMGPDNTQALSKPQGLFSAILKVIEGFISNFSTNYKSQQRTKDKLGDMSTALEKINNEQEKEIPAVEGVQSEETYRM